MCEELISFRLSLIYFTFSSFRYVLLLCHPRAGVNSLFILQGNARNFTVTEYFSMRQAFPLDQVLAIRLLLLLLVLLCFHLLLKVLIHIRFCFKVPYMKLWYWYQYIAFPFNFRDVGVRYLPSSY